MERPFDAHVAQVSAGFKLAQVLPELFVGHSTAIGEDYLRRTITRIIGQPVIAAKPRDAFKQVTSSVVIEDESATERVRFFQRRFVNQNRHRTKAGFGNLFNVRKSAGP